MLDPFAGVGTTALAARRHNRRALLCERDPAYVAQTHVRLAARADGTVGYRPLGRPVSPPRTAPHRPARAPQRRRGARRALLS